MTGRRLAVPGERRQDEEVRRLVDEAYRDAEGLLGANWEKVESVAQALLKHETLSGDDVHRLMRGESLNRSSLSDLLAQERAPRAAGGRTEPERGDDAAPGLVPSPA